MQQIDKLIINSPYDEPQSYWLYNREKRELEQREGRRPAGYVIATPGSSSFDDPGVPVEIKLPGSPAGRKAKKRYKWTAKKRRAE